jgi:secretion/DNA translocation related TadE-like protein
VALLGATATTLGAVAVARQRAASAADLSALAAAGAALDGPAAACARAARLADRVGAELSSCRLDGDVATVVAQVRPSGPLARLGAASARARAGPVLGMPTLR